MLRHAGKANLCDGRDAFFENTLMYLKRKLLDAHEVYETDIVRPYPRIIGTFVGKAIEELAFLFVDRALT